MGSTSGSASAGDGVEGESGGGAALGEQARFGFVGQCLSGPAPHADAPLETDGRQIGAHDFHHGNFAASITQRDLIAAYCQRGKDIAVRGQAGKLGQ